MGRRVGGKVCVWVDGQVGRWRRRTLDEALRDLCVQSLRVAALDHVKGHVEEDLGGFGLGC